MSTAPDPGLTDLIAAHWYNTSTCMCTCGWSTRHLPESDDDTRIGILVARHLALVVEQHTNGRTAELEARITEAQSLCHDTGRYNAARQKHWNIRVFACDVLAALKGRAALEGEQQ